MKNKIQIMFVRGLQKALNHDNGPRLPRHWKVIASTLSRFDSLSIVSRQSDLDSVGGISALFSSRVYRYVAVLLMVFTLGIGNVWGTETSIVFSSSNKDDSNTAFGTFSNGSSITAGDSIIKIFSKNNSNWAFSNTNKKGYRADRDKFVFHFTGETDLSVQFSQNSTNGVYLKLAPFTTTKKYVKDIVESDFSTTGSIIAFESVSGDNSFADAPTISVATDKMSWSWLKKGGVKVEWKDIPAGWYELQLNGTNESYIYGFTADVASTTYTVTLNPNEGGYASTPTGWTASAGNYTKTVSAGALTIPEPAREGYDFNGWKSGLVDVTLSSGNLTVSKDTTLTAQWATPKATPEVTFNDGDYTVGAAALDLSGLFTSDNTNTPSFALKVASDDATVSGSNFTATKAGSYVVVATQAADATYKAVEEEATITVTWPATGAATITYNLDVTNSGTTLQTLSTTNATSSSISVAASTSLLYGGLTKSSSKGSHNGTRTLGINTLAEETADKYFGVTFTVADDYMFTPSAISLKVLTIGGNATSYKAVLTDGTNSIVGTVDATNDSEKTLGSWSGLGTTNLSGTVTLKLYAWYTTSGSFNAYRLSTPITISGTVAVAPTTYDLTFAAGTGASGSMSTLKYAEGVEVTLPACTFTPPTGKEFDEWVVTKTAGGASVTVTNNKFTMPAEAVTATATWKDEVVKYTITEGTPEHGSVDADVAEAAAGETVTLTATPDEDYVFSAWDVYKTGESSTKVSVTNNTFTMPAYAVTVNATFAADPRAKVLYVTSNSESDTKSDDKLYAALKDTYNVKIVGPASDADQSGYALIVLHESIDGKNDYNKTAVATAKTGSIPVLNTKSYFYPSGRWNWGTPNAGTSVKGATMNSAYCNIADHPLFNDVTVSEGFIEITDDAAAKCMQPVGSFTSGYEGYTLATTPNAESGNGCAIHEIPAGTTARGVSSGKYLMISVSNAKLDALNANGQKLFQNAAAYLIDGSASWTPIVVPTAAAITADPNAAYFVGDNIALTASAIGTSAATTYTWYKGDNLADAKEAGAIKAAATAAAGGNTYGVTGCALADAGTYWCVISNGTDCEAAASLEVTVSDVSYDIAFVSAHGTAPSATTGVSYTLPELSADGWAHQGWTANINVTVDAATVDAGDLIANGKLAVFEANVTFTAVWVQVFDVTFNMQSHGAAVAAQHILDGGKATEPNDPSAIGWVFGGWFTDAECTAGNEFDFNTAISDDTELFAKWTAFAGCVELWPATSGDAPTAANEVINLQEGSTGGSIVTVSAKDNKFNESFEYTTHGLALKKGGADVIGVTLNSEIAIGTKISVTLYSNNTGARGLNLLTSTGAKIGSGVTLGWADATVGAIETFTYTAEENDGLVGTNGFRLQRNNTVYLKTLKVESCGATIIYHGLTSAVDPTGKGTVTLGASSVREGYTTTATYSDIDEAYEFDTWLISGTGASIADASANPAVITMGTADAVVTLKLKAATPKHTVTYDVKGHGVAPASEDVKEGAKVTKPADPTAENWAFVGWYKETTLENEWNFDVDVMGEENITLYAKWEDESGAIKLFNGNVLNTTNFISAAATTIEISEVEYPCLVAFASNRTSLAGAKQGDLVMYSATTNATKIKFDLYNANTSAKTAYLWMVEEGATESGDPIEIEVSGQTRITTAYYSFNSTKNRSFYLTSGSKNDIKVLQAKVIESGSAIKQFGQAGYSLKLNQGRIAAASAVQFEGATVNVSSEYAVLNNSNLATKSYIKFTTTVDKMILHVEKSGGKFYVSQDPEDKGTIYNANADVELTPAGEWYLGSETSGSAASFTNIEFIAPKCAEPAFNALANSDICEGSSYEALDGTGTVSDGGSISYKWYAEGSETVLATTAKYTPSADGNYYVVALHHVDGYTDNEVTSDVVTVKTHAGTAITAELADQRGNVDDVVTLEVTATGKNVHYAWKECATIDGEYTAVAGAADAASLDVTITEGMDKYYKVIVSSACGDAQESVAHVTQYVPVAQANVTGSIAWNWANAASVNEIKLTASTSPKKNEGFVMANGKATVYNNANFESDKLYLEGEYIVRDGKYFQGQTIKFNTTVAGAVRVKFSHTGNNKPARELYINGVGTGDSRTSATAEWSRYVEVPAGEVTITAYHVDPADGAGQQYIRVPEIEFLTIAHQRTSGYAAGDLGTVCLEDATIINGAKLYELGGLDGNGYLAFDEITNGKLEAGKPYLFEVTNPSLISFYKQVNAAHSDDEIETNGMIGTFSGTTLYQGAENLYYFAGRHIWRVNDFTVSIPIPAHRCYVDMDDVEPAQAPAPGRRRVTLGINGNNAPTDVENVQSDEVQCTKVMINGQLFILRGEKMFGIDGKLIK